MGKGFRAFLKERIREKILSTALVLSLISLMSLLDARSEEVGFLCKVSARLSRSQRSAWSSSLMTSAILFDSLKCHFILSIGVLAYGIPNCFNVQLQCELRRIVAHCC